MRRTVCLLPPRQAGDWGAEQSCSFGSPQETHSKHTPWATQQPKEGESEFEAAGGSPREPDELKMFQGESRRLRKFENPKGRLQLCFIGCWKPQVTCSQESVKAPPRLGSLPHLSPAQGEMFNNQLAWSGLFAYIVYWHKKCVITQFTNNKKIYNTHYCNFHIVN